MSKDEATATKATKARGGGRRKAKDPSSGGPGFLKEEGDERGEDTGDTSKFMSSPGDPGTAREANRLPTVTTGDRDRSIAYDGTESGGTESSFDEESAKPAYFADQPLEVVIGEDDRVQITNTTTFPWRAVCALRIRAQNGSSWIGTGWLVSPRTLITAGHCVYMRDQGGWASRIEVIPGKNGEDQPFESAVSTRFRSVLGWTRDHVREYDYAAILLPSTHPLGTRVGRFGFTAEDDAALRGAKLNLSGYPGDKDHGATQWWHARQVMKIAPRVLEYDIDTAGGQSGAPVWRLVNGTRYAVGIHTNGLSSGNSATRIQANVYENITAWAAEGA